MFGSSYVRWCWWLPWRAHHFKLLFHQEKTQGKRVLLGTPREDTPGHQSYHRWSRGGIKHPTCMMQRVGDHEYVAYESIDRFFDSSIAVIIQTPRIEVGICQTNHTSSLYLITLLSMFLHRFRCVLDCSRMLDLVACPMFSDWSFDSHKDYMASVFNKALSFSREFGWYRNRWEYCIYFIQVLDVYNLGMYCVKF